MQPSGGGSEKKAVFMSHELIERVKRAEEKADAVLAAASEKAAKIVEDAEADSRASFDKRVKALSAKKEKAFADAEGEGKREADALLEAAAGERKAAEAKWRKNSPRAADFVKDFVLKH